MNNEKRYEMNNPHCLKHELKHLEYIKTTLFAHLGYEVNTPQGTMVLVELYSNGNVACIPLNCNNYKKQLSEFHALSITPTIN